MTIEILQCPVCNEKTPTEKFRAKENRDFTGEFFFYAKCGSCRCMRLLFDEKTDIHRYNNYYSFQKIDHTFYQSNEGEKLLQKISKKIESRAFKYNPHFRYELFRHYSIKKNDAILDVGCGSGDFLYPLSLLGYQKLLGQDPFLPEIIHYSENYKVTNAPLDKIDQEFDVIFLHHSLEHAEKQHDLIHQLLRLIKENGKIFIRIPLSSSVAFEKFKENWWQLDAPYHLFLHTPDSLKVLLESEGLRLEKVIFDSTNVQFSNSQAIAAGHPYHSHHLLPKTPRLLKSTNKVRASILNWMGKGDQAVFVAHKGPVHRKS